MIVIGVSHNSQPLSASISILFPGLPLHFSDINSAFEKGMETFFFSRKLGISNRKDNMSLLFFDRCRRLAFRDAIQKFCPFPVSFFFFFWWPEGRVSLLLKHTVHVFQFMRSKYYVIRADEEVFCSRFWDAR